MLILEMSARWSLLELRESGCGFQFIEFTRSKSRLQALAVNASMLFLEEDLVREASFRAQPTRDADRLLELHGLRLLSAKDLLAGSTLAKFAHTRADGAADAEVTFTSKGDVYKRFSAFAQDLRITNDGALRPGSYATTGADAANVRTGAQAVERYALPNSDPAIWVFTIEPFTNTSKRQGIVQPAFGHAGGGVEVLFVAGTAPQTVTNRTTIPPR